APVAAVARKIIGRSRAPHLSRTYAGLQHRYLSPRRPRRAVSSRRCRQSSGNRSPRHLLPVVGVLAGAVGARAGVVSEFFARESCRCAAHLAEAGAVSGSNSVGCESGGGAAVFVERQTRLGNLAAPSDAGSGASVSRMATAVTWPMISASVP